MQLALAPLAPGDYVIELTAGAEKSRTAGTATGVVLAWTIDTLTD